MIWRRVASNTDIFNSQVLRTDIVMDVGESLNPAIDIGQIEGAFMQGYGLFCMERLKYSPKGFNFTRGPSTYKIPGKSKEFLPSGWSSDEVA